MRASPRLRSATSSICSASRTVSAIGFSHSTCFPASSAAIVWRAWASGVEDTMTRSTSGARASASPPSNALGTPNSAGAGRAQEQAELEAALIDAGVARQVRVLADGEVALATAFGTGPGILVNAGTGSIAYARDPAGELHRAGGYGWQLGDEGGGYWLGRRALDVAARSHDGRGEGSTLLARLLGALGLQHFDDLVRWSATATPAQMAALAPHVLNAAREGEGVARQAVDDAARELVELVEVLAPHFPGTGPVSVAIAGGLLLPQSPLTAAFRERLATALKRARLVPDKIDSAVGALKLAAELGG